MPAPVQGEAQPLTAEDYIALRVPRLPDVPSSAPIYDDITRPVTYPKLSCMSSSDPQMVAKNHKRLTLGYREGKVYGCRCNTQQGTRAVVSFEACMGYVEEGAFDPAKPDRITQPAINPEQQQATYIPPQPGASAVPAQTNAPSATGSRVVVVGDSSRMPRTLK